MSGSRDQATFIRPTEMSQITAFGRRIDAIRFSVEDDRRDRDRRLGGKALLQRSRMLGEREA